MTESREEIARRHDELVASGGDLGNLTRIGARVKQPADVVYSTRYTEDEIALIRKAAAQRKMSTSAFIRAAALAAADGELDLSGADKAEQWSEVRSITRRLEAAVSSITGEEPTAARPRRRRA